MSTRAQRDEKFIAVGLCVSLCVLTIFEYDKFCVCLNAKCQCMCLKFHKQILDADADRVFNR